MGGNAKRLFRRAFFGLALHWASICCRVSPRGAVINGQNESSTCGFALSEIFFHTHHIPVADKNPTTILSVVAYNLATWTTRYLNWHIARKYHPETHTHLVFFMSFRQMVAVREPKNSSTSRTSRYPVSRWFFFMLQKTLFIRFGVKRGNDDLMKLPDTFLPPPMSKPTYWNRNPSLFGSGSGSGPKVGWFFKVYLFLWLLLHYIFPESSAWCPR